MFDQTDRQAYALARKIVEIGPEHAGFGLAQTTLEKFAEAARTGKELNSFAPFFCSRRTRMNFPR